MAVRLILLVFIFLPFFSCERKEKAKTEKPTILVSIPPYAYFVNKIAQDAVEVETLIPAGTNPHIYEATPKEVQRYQNAALWIYLGESFDKKAFNFFQAVRKSIQIIDITEGVNLLSISEEDEIITEHARCHHHHNEGKDLHIWLSPALAKLQAEKIAKALIELIPDKQEKFRLNLKTFLNELDDLDQQIANMLRPMKGKAILVSHPAFGYFCRDYHLVQLSIEIEGKEPLPQHITEILSKAKSYSIQTVLMEPQYSDKGAKLLAHSLGLPTHMVDPYAENFSENLLTIAKIIAK
jgi:zinc transport system substrate-binding protein